MFNTKSLKPTRTFRVYLSNNILKTIRRGIVDGQTLKNISKYIVGELIVIEQYKRRDQEVVTTLSIAECVTCNQRLTNTVLFTIQYLQ